MDDENENENGNDTKNTADMATPPGDDPHRDLDRSSIPNLVRLIGLMQAGWTISRGNGPRHHAHCLWCRGALSEHTEIIVHTHSKSGGGPACQNAWAASCFMEFVNYEYDQATARSLSCPMCRSTFHTRAGTTRQRPPHHHLLPEAPFDIAQIYPHYHPRPEAHDFELTTHDAIPALVRIVMYNPASVLEAVWNGKTVTVMSRDEVAKLTLFGRNKDMFDLLDGVMTAAKSDNKRVFLTWAVIDWGNNEYRACPLLPRQEAALQEIMATNWVETVKDVSAKMLEDQAMRNGGLATAVAAFTPDAQDQDIQEMTSGGKEEALRASQGASQGKKAKTLEEGLIDHWKYLRGENDGGEPPYVDSIQAAVNALFRAFGIRDRRMMGYLSPGGGGDEEEVADDEEEEEVEEEVEEEEEEEQEEEELLEEEDEEEQEQEPEQEKGDKHIHLVGNLPALFQNIIDNLPES